MIVVASTCPASPQPSHSVPTYRTGFPRKKLFPVVGMLPPSMIETACRAAP
jgi:hypothetical protein